MAKRKTKSAAPPIESRVVPSVKPSRCSPARVKAEFLRLLKDGARLQSVGTTRRRPRRLLTLGYAPTHKLELFDVVYYLSRPRQNEDMRFFVAYVDLAGRTETRPSRAIHARLFYKDVSLVWRSASHFAQSESENWVGKGDLKTYIVDGEETESTDEATSDLPLEIQGTLEALSRLPRKLPYDSDAIHRVLRRGSDDRIEPYRDFSGPRQRAAADPRNLVNGGRQIARFTRKNDPTSLRFMRGYEPDFARGPLDVSESTSKLYGGKIRRFRLVSKNEKVQYLFIAGPRQVWVGSCQATTTQIMSYGVRTLDAPVDEDLLLPGYEYHFMEEIDGEPSLHSQIPPGFAGPASEFDDFRADTSPWLEKMPVIREFRRKVLPKHPFSSKARR